MKLKLHWYENHIAGGNYYWTSATIKMHKFWIFKWWKQV